MPLEKPPPVGGSRHNTQVMRDLKDHTQIPQLMQLPDQLEDGSYATVTPTQSSGSSQLSSEGRLL